MEQLNLAFGRNVPYAYGPFTAMSSPTDTLSNAPANQQAGINLLLNTLQQSSQPVDIMSFGSARVIAAAYNRDPTLMEQKVGMIYLSAGSQPSGITEWNVNLDMSAYQCLLTSNLPVTLMPCATNNSPFDVGEYNTYYQLPNMNFINSMDPTLKRYMAYQFNQETTSAFLPALSQPTTGAMMSFTSQSHNVWETAAWMAASGQELVQHTNGTYAIIPPSQQQSGDTVLPNNLVPVNIAYNGNGQYSFTPTAGTTNKWEYDRGTNPGLNQTALQQALPRLVRLLHCQQPEPGKPERCAGEQSQFRVAEPCRRTVHVGGQQRLRCDRRLAGEESRRWPGRRRSASQQLHVRLDARWEQCPLRLRKLLAGQHLGRRHFPGPSHPVAAKHEVRPTRPWWARGWTSPAADTTYDSWPAGKCSPRTTIPSRLRPAISSRRWCPTRRATSRHPAILKSNWSD